MRNGHTQNGEKWMRGSVKIFKKNNLQHNALKSPNIILYLLA